MDSRHLLDVFIAGVQKGGTTTLFSYLREHPQINAPSGKELHFFDNESMDWEKPDYQLLQGFFPEARPDALGMDATPIYCFWPQSLERIKAYNPQAKFILLFRDPFERAWSHWCMEYARDMDSMPFAEAIRTYETRVAGLAENAAERRVFSYLERGRYGQQVERLLSLFPRENLLFLLSDDLKSDPHATLRRICGFLKIEAFAHITEKFEHVRKAIDYPCAPTEEDLRFFQERLGDEMMTFRALSGLDIGHWPIVTGQCKAISVQAAEPVPLRKVSG
ncbi:sulfotransferase family protein [Rhizobium paknamense]|uniref:Sulfotransferase domain-containing protein n=1 Tax=Rhizobium paknamense TaxID=1206817 RepID=A0ABU0I795_9HYPH|nr:sulfotransferase [Rhizobium paknamense]MDQ0454093.1 hypothetical protein [Rhizobium paknamense]